MLVLSCTSFSYVIAKVKFLVQCQEISTWRPFQPPSTTESDPESVTGRSTTVSVTRFSAARGTGASRSRSTTRTASRLRFRSRNCLSSCLRSRSSNLPTVSRLSRGRRSGPEGYPLETSTMPGFAGSTPTTSAIWILATTRLSSIGRLMNIGVMWICTSVVQSTLRDTLYIPASGTSSSLTLVMSARTSRSASWSTRV